MTDEGRGYVAVDDTLSESFCDSRLADTRLSDLDMRENEVSTKAKEAEDETRGLTRTGLFLVLRQRIRITRRISLSRPMTGSYFPSAAICVMSTEYFLKASKSVRNRSGQPPNVDARTESGRPLTLFGVLAVDLSAATDRLYRRFDRILLGPRLLQRLLHPSVLEQSEDEMVLSDIRVVLVLHDLLCLSEDLCPR